MASWKAVELVGDGALILLTTEPKVKELLPSGARQWMIMVSIMLVAVDVMVMEVR